MSGKTNAIEHSFSNGQAFVISITAPHDYVSGVADGCEVVGGRPSEGFIVLVAMLIRENVVLASFTTLGVGGAARYFTEASTEAEVVEAVEVARSRQLPLFVLGGGSNIVVADAGFRGMVLKIGIADVIQRAYSPGLATLDAGAGYDWDTLVALTVDANCAGVECLSGIPGTVGGTPIQNVGAYGQEASQSIQEVQAFDLHSMQLRTLSAGECGFGYRSSIFNTSERGRYVIVRVSFAVRPGGKPTIVYAELQKYFAERRREPTLAEVRAAVREIRRRKAMLIVAGDDDGRSVGSFFKNPIVPQSSFRKLAERLAEQGLELPSYPAADGFRKLPAAWLVEQAGFAKGYGMGRAGISRRHSLAIVNRGGATAAEILALKDKIQAQVQEKFGIVLEPEPVFVGF